MPSSTGPSGSKRRGSEVVESTKTGGAGGTGAVNGKIKVESLQTDRERFLNAFESKFLS